MPDTEPRPEASQHQCLRSSDQDQVTQDVGCYFRVILQYSASDSENISVPLERPFTREMFLRLRESTDQVPEVPVEDDEDL